MTIAISSILLMSDSPSGSVWASCVLDTVRQLAFQSLAVLAAHNLRLTLQKCSSYPPHLHVDHKSLLEQLSENSVNIKVFLGAKTKEAASALATLKV